MQPVRDLHSGLDERAVILGKISHRSLVSPDNPSAGEELPAITTGFAKFALGDGRRVCQQSIQQGRLAGSVAAHERDLFTAADACREWPYDLAIIVGLGHAFEFENVFAGRSLLLKLQKRTLN